MEKITTYKKAILVNLGEGHYLIMPYAGNMTQIKKIKCAHALIKFLDDKGISYHKTNYPETQALFHLDHHSLSVKDLVIKNYNFMHNDGTVSPYIDIGYDNGASIGNKPERVEILEIK